MTEETLGPEVWLVEDLLSVFEGRADLLLGAARHGTARPGAVTLGGGRVLALLPLLEQLLLQHRETVVAATPWGSYVT